MDKSIIYMVWFGLEISVSPFAEIFNYNLICIQRNFFLVVFICSNDLVISYQFPILVLPIQIFFVSRSLFI